MIYCIQVRPNLENLIFETFQTPAVGKTLKPYQGLKYETLIGCAFLNSSARHKNSKTLSGIETASCLSAWFLRLVISGHKNPKTLSGIETLHRLKKKLD